MLVWFVREPGGESATFLARTAKGPREPPPFCSGITQTEKGGDDGEAAISGSIPALVLHCGESLRTNFRVRAVGVGPPVVSVCAPWLVGFADGSAIGFPAHGLAVLAVGALGEWTWSRLRRFTGFVSDLRQCSKKLLEA